MKLQKIEDVAISRRFNLPARTLADWKKADKDNWRYRVYTFFKEFLYGEEYMINDREIQINQRVGLLKKLFGDYMEDYNSLDVIDNVMCGNLREITYIRDHNIVSLRGQIYNNLNRIINADNKHLEAAIRVIDKCTNHNDLIQLLIELNLTKGEQKEKKEKKYDQAD